MGTIKVSDMIGNNIKVDKNGAVTGSINFLSQNDGAPNDGHYFPTQIDKKHYGERLHAGGQVIGDEFVAGSDFTPNAEDPYLNVRVESCTDGNKISVYSEDKTELFSIDFNEATLEPPVGKNAVIVPEVGKDFGRFGKASDFYDVKPKISWNGINGKVNGTIKWVSEGTAEKLTSAGNYYPLVLSDFYVGQKNTVNGKTAQEYEWIANVTKTKTITVKLGEKTIAVLDFSEAEFKDDTPED